MVSNFSLDHSKSFTHRHPVEAVLFDVMLGGDDVLGQVQVLQGEVHGGLELLLPAALVGESENTRQTSTIIKNNSSR